eukprot:6863073-Prorocentrum_lima.AAC.1
MTTPFFYCTYCEAATRVGCSYCCRCHHRIHYEPYQGATVGSTDINRDMFPYHDNEQAIDHIAPTLAKAATLPIW